MEAPGRFSHRLQMLKSNIGGWQLNPLILQIEKQRHKKVKWFEHKQARRTQSPNCHPPFLSDRCRTLLQLYWVIMQMSLQCFKPLLGVSNLCIQTILFPSH